MSTITQEVNTNMDLNLMTLVQRRDQIKSQLSEQSEGSSWVEGGGTFEDSMKDIINKSDLHWNSVMKEAVSKT